MFYQKKRVATSKKQQTLSQLKKQETSNLQLRIGKQERKGLICIYITHLSEYQMDLGQIRA